MLSLSRLRQDSHFLTTVRSLHVLSCFFNYKKDLPVSDYSSPLEIKHVLPSQLLFQSLIIFSFLRFGTLYSLKHVDLVVLQQIFLTWLQEFSPVSHRSMSKHSQF